MQNASSSPSPEILWTPGPEQLQSSRLVHYQRWLEREGGVATRDYAELWRWSVDDLSRFWQSIWSYFDIQADGDREPALGRREMPGAEWFPKARLNFAEHVLRHARPDQPAVKQQIRSKVSGRHVPDAIVQVSEIPRTLSGKKMEVPVRKLLLGAEPGKVASPDAMQNPSSLAFFVQYARTRNLGLSQVRPESR